MVRKRFAVAASAVAVLVASCGSAEDEADQVSGVDEASQQDDEGVHDDAQDSGSEEAEEIDRPDIVVPEDLVNEFEDVSAEDPTEQSVWRDNEYYVQSLDEAVAADDTDGGMVFYTIGQALEVNQGYVAGMREDSLRYAGTIRYFNREIARLDEDEGVAEVEYCVDASDSYEINTETGEETPNPGETAFYSMLMVLNDDGVWQTSHVEVEMAENVCA